jgi:hypothetical protein
VVVVGLNIVILLLTMHDMNNIKIFKYIIEKVSMNAVLFVRRGITKTDFKVDQKISVLLSCCVRIVNKF